MVDIMDRGMHRIRARKSSKPPYAPGRCGCVVVVVAQRDVWRELRDDTSGIRYFPSFPIDSHKMSLWLAPVDAGRMVHCPVPSITPENRPTDRSEP